ncbi:GlsB/YeaQ/YmgE family stress response membrane protein [Streptomyces sviceus]|uniref:GlsB/YeaQ/YmgE family stress response membrane protein n=1 Tax=Streptomyces sviceus TaxID=285530 RepID=UPI003D9DB1B5
MDGHGRYSCRGLRLEGHAAADLARLGRLVVHGRQRIGLLWTIGIGTVAAFIGTGIAGGLGVADTKGVDWVEWLIQIALAAFGVAALSKVKVRH